MKPNEGRLQTGEHILAKIIEDKITDAKTGFVKFEEGYGLVEFTSKEDLRKIDLNKLQYKVNEIINRNLPVHKYIKDKKEAEKEVDMRKVPTCVQEVRIVDIEGFDKRPCKDPHVDNTNEIGNFIILKINRV